MPSPAAAAHAVARLAPVSPGPAPDRARVPSKAVRPASRP